MIRPTNVSGSGKIGCQFLRLGCALLRIQRIEPVHLVLSQLLPLRGVIL